MKNQSYLRKRQLSVSVFLSYFCVALVPIVCAWVIFTMAQASMLDTQIERANSRLLSAVSDIESDISEITSLSAYIANSNSLTSSSVLKKSHEDVFYQLYLLFNDGVNYSTANPIVEDVLILYNDIPYMISNTIVLNNNEIYQNIITAGYPTPLSDRLINENTEYYNQKIHYDYSKESGRFTISAFQSFPYASGTGGTKGTVVVVLNHEQFMDNLTSGFSGHPDYTFYIKHNSSSYYEVINDDHSLTSHIEPDFLKINNDEFDLNGTTYLQLSVEKNDLSFYLVLNKEDLVAQIGLINRLIPIAVIISIAFAVVMSIYWLYRQRALISSYADYEQTNGGRQSLWQGLQKAIDDNFKLRDSVRDQRLERERQLLRSLLLGGFANGEVLEQSVKDTIFSQCKNIFIVVIYCNVPQNGEHLLEAIQDKLNLPYRRCVLNHGEIVLFINADRIFSSEELKHTLDDVLSNADGNRIEPIFVGISELFNDLIITNEAYEQAKTVCGYLQYHNFKLTMEYRDIPKESTYFYPLDVEKAFSKYMESNNKQKAMEILQSVIVTNMGQRVLTITMQKSLLHLVKSTIIRCINSSPAHGNIEATKSISELDDLEKIFFFLEECFDRLFGASLHQEEDTQDRIRKMITDSLSNSSYCIEDLAKLLNVSEKTLYNDIKRYFNMSFTSYLEHLRIQEACVQLQQDKLIKNVATDVGYTCEYSFRRAFKKVIGITPSVFIASKKQEE